MSIKSVLKVLGAAAVVAGLTPYKVKKDEDTGEVKATALLWNAAYTPAAGEKDKKVVVNVGLTVPGKNEEETHIYADDVTVNYDPETEAAAPEGEPAPAEEETPADNAPVEEETPVQESEAAPDEESEPEA